MYSFRLGVEKLLTEQDKMQRALKAAQVPNDSAQWDGWKTTVGKIGVLVDWHSGLQNQPGPPIEDRKPRHSERKDMKGLPDDWRERIVARLPKYRRAVLTQGGDRLPARRAGEGRQAVHYGRLADRRNHRFEGD